MKRIVIFASGSGTNAANIISHFRQSSLARVVLVLSNKRDAKVMNRADKLGIPTHHFTKEELYSRTGVVEVLRAQRPDLIVLAGFLLKFPENILQEYPNKVINIHPALLPKYGGKGMYGAHVHEAVIANKEKESGITVHRVNEAYDEGAIVFQKSTPVSESDTSESLAGKIQELEHAHFPKVIEELLHTDEPINH